MISQRRTKLIYAFSALFLLALTLLLFVLAIVTAVQPKNSTGLVVALFAADFVCFIATALMAVPLLPIHDKPWPPGK